MIENAKITVKGIVQGVGYRWFADRTAREYELQGFVENHPNGDVFLEVEGGEDYDQKSNKGTPIRTEDVKG